MLATACDVVVQKEKLITPTPLSLGSKACRGDLIGVQVDFSKKLAPSSDIEVTFTLNEQKLQTLVISAERKLYPYVGIGSKEIRVLAKVRRLSLPPENKTGFVFLGNMIANNPGAKLRDVVRNNTGQRCKTKV